MRILHVYRTYFPDTQGGLEEAIRQITIATHALGVENRLLFLSDSPHPETVTVDDAIGYRVKKHMEIASCSISLTPMKTYRALTGWADVIHYHHPWPFQDALHVLSPPAVPAIVTYHSDIVRQRLFEKLYAPLRSAFFKRVDHIVATSPNYLRTSPVLARYRDKTSVIPLGLCESSYQCRGTDASDPVSTDLAPGFFFFIGVHRYYKGLHVLLNAMQGAPYTLVIAGTGPETTRLKAQSRALGLDNVVFTGQVTDAQKRELLDRASAFVLPSHKRSEAFGVSLLEGAMAGLPLICADLDTGTTYINHHEDTGLVTKPGCSQSLRDAMDTLHANPDLASRYGNNARKRFERLFRGEFAGQQYLSLYESLV